MLVVYLLAHSHPSFVILIYLSIYLRPENINFPSLAIHITFMSIPQLYDIDKGVINS
jgi:hypothetical protein